jgi:hypothetical protein
MHAPTGRPGGCARPTPASLALPAHGSIDDRRLILTAGSGAKLYQSCLQLTQLWSAP